MSSGQLIFGLLVLPIAAAVLFLKVSHTHRFASHHMLGQRLVFEVLAYAVIFLVIAEVILFFGRVDVRTQAAVSWLVESPSLHAYLQEKESISLINATGITTLILALISAFVWNLLVYWRMAKHPAVASDGNKKFLYRVKKAAIARYVEGSDEPQIRMLFLASELRKSVMATMKSGKVYVGTVSNSVDPTLPDRYLRILPVLSGYRDPQNKKVTFTTEYTEIHRQLEAFRANDARKAPALFDAAPKVKFVSPLAGDPGTVDGGEAEVDARHFGILLPWEEIEALTHWDPDVYAYFNSSVTPTPNTATGAATGVIATDDHEI